jgi:hypothetical protein
MLSITPNFNMSDIDKDLQQFIAEVELHVISSFKAAGKSFVDKARAKTKDEKGFGNITWNLRSSIGYVIVKDHNIVERYFPPYRNGSEGNKQGIAYAEEMALLLDDGEIRLVVVAGMEYAALVEATDHDVITGSSLKFESEFKKLLNS